MDFKFREMTNEDKNALICFLYDNFGKDSLQCKPNRFEWQVVNNPNNARAYLCFFSDELIGQTDYLPGLLRLGDEQFTAAFSVDTMILHKYRRKGIGQKFHQTRLDNYQVALSSGQSHANRKLYGKMGWKKLGSYFKFKIVKRFPKFEFNKLFIKDMFSFLRYKARVKRLNKNPSIKYMADFPDRMLNLLERGVDDEAYIKNDPVSLKWRYQDHPYFTYNYIEVFDGCLSLGCCVTRELTKGCCKLVDFYCKRGDLAGLLEGLTYSLNADCILGQIMGDSLQEYFRKTGFTVTLLPNGCLMGSSKDKRIYDKLDQYNWLLLGSDSDIDK